MDAINLKDLLTLALPLGLSPNTTSDKEAQTKHTKSLAFEPDRNSKNSSAKLPDILVFFSL